MNPSFSSDSSGSDGAPLANLRPSAKKKQVSSKKKSHKSDNSLHGIRTKGLAGTKKNTRRPTEERSSLLKRYSDWVMTVNARSPKEGGHPGGRIMQLAPFVRLLKTATKRLYDSGNITSQPRWQTGAVLFLKDHIEGLIFALLGNASRISFFRNQKTMMLPSLELAYGIMAECEKNI